MSLLLRCAFWLTVLAFLLPSPETPTRNDLSANGVQTTAFGRSEGQEAVDAGEMLTLAARSAQDVMGFCDRNRSVCDRGSAVVAHVIDQSVYYGSQAFVWLSEKAREQQQIRQSQPSAPASASAAAALPRSAGV